MMGRKSFRNGARVRSYGRVSEFALAIATLALPAVAAAQTAPAGQSPDDAAVSQDEAAPQAADSDTREIVVTGSRLRNVAPIGSNVMVVGSDQLESSGALTTERFLQQVPAVVNIGFSEGSRSGNQGGGNNPQGNSAINLRGISPNATLTLVNGHRFIKSGRGGNAVDPTNIPTTALGRIEVLPDGASAVYGSDAVAGVVNLILRRNYEGIDIRSRYGFADDYNERSLALLAGTKWSTGQVTVSAEYNYHTALAGKSRDFNRQDLREFGGTDQRSNQCYPGTIVIGTGASAVTYAIPTVTNGTLSPTDLVAGTQNLCSPYEDADILPEQTRYTAAATFDQEIAPGIKFTADAQFAHKDYYQKQAYTTSNITVTNANPWFVLPAGAPANTTQYVIRYSLGGPYGNVRPNRGYTEAWQVFGNLQFDLFKDWTLDVSSSYGHDSEFTNASNFNNSLLTTYLNSSDPAVAADPYGLGRTSAATLADIIYYEVRSRSNSSLTTAEASASGTVFSLPGGDVRLAIGTEYNREAISNANWTGRVGLPPRGERSVTNQVKSVYAEGAIPLFSSTNAVPGIQKLELSIAARYSSYDRYGSTTNPKFGINWVPVEGLKLRSSYGTSFRAPNAQELVGVIESSSVMRDVVDPSTGLAVKALFFTSGNLDLEPETAKTFSVGADLEPRFAPGLRLSGTYWSIDYKNQIVSNFANLGILVAGTTYQDLVTLNPTNAEIAAITAAYPLVGASAPLDGGTKAIVDGRPSNLGATYARGIDLEISYRFNTGVDSSLNVQASGTYMTRYDIQASDAADPVSFLNQYNYPVKFRSRGGLTWNSGGGFNASTNLNYVGSYWDTVNSPRRKISSWTTVDLYLGYNFEKGPGLMGGWGVAMNVTNAFDRDPPFVNIAPNSGSAGGYDPQQASALGRLVSFSLSKKF